MRFLKIKYYFYETQLIFNSDHFMKHFYHLLTFSFFILFHLHSEAQNPNNYQVVSLCNLNLNRTATKLTSTELQTVDPAYKGFVWNTGDNETEKWRPQGVTDISLGCRKYIAVSWYGRSQANYSNRGGRISLVDISDMNNIKYRHILLVDENYNALSGIHVGGLFYKNDTIYVPDTRSGSNKRIYGFDLTDIKRIPPSDQSSFYNYGYMVKRVATHYLPIKASTMSYDWDSGEMLVATFDKACTTGCTFNPNTEFSWFDINGVSSSSSYHQHFFDKAQGMASMNNPQNPNIKLTWFSSSYGRNNDSHLYATQYDRNPNNISGQTVNTGSLDYATFTFPPGLENLHITQNNQTIWSLTEFNPNEGTGNNRFVFAMRIKDILPPGVSLDTVPPTTDVSFSTDWKTQDFDAHYTDADETGGSGLDKSLYQVLYFNGNTWSANSSNGFFSDNFSGTNLSSNWTNETGSWGISSNNTLEQTNNTEGNTNMHAPLTQNLSNRYLYTWNGKIDGNDDNKRAGIHIFCDDATQSNRGNSYLVYFRAGGNPDPSLNNKIQIYKSINNSLTLEKSISYVINAGQWYDYKVAFDRITGEMVIGIDEHVAAKWTDPNPFSDGNAVSFRSGNCNYEVDNFKVYRSRYPDVTVTVGPGSNTDLPYQNPDPNTPSGKVKSIVMDNAGNISSVDFQFVDVDWTKPINLEVNDGLGADIDTVYSSLLEANWGTANDPHSGIVEYKVAIGTTAGADDVVGWATNGTNTTISNILPVINYNQVYYFSVVAKNGAGLSDTASSDGQIYLESLQVQKSELQEIEMYPNPTVDQLQFTNLSGQANICIYDMKGRLLINQKVSQNSNKIDVHHLKAGTYNVTIRVNQQFVVQKFVKE